METLNESTFQLFNTELLEKIYRILIKTRGKNVRIVVRKFFNDPVLKVDPYDTNEPLTIPRYVPFEVKEVFFNGDIRTTLRGELSFAEIMNRFDHAV